MKAGCPSTPDMVARQSSSKCTHVNRPWRAAMWEQLPAGMCMWGGTYAKSASNLATKHPAGSRHLLHCWQCR